MSESKIYHVERLTDIAQSGDESSHRLVWEHAGTFVSDHAAYRAMRDWFEESKTDGTIQPGSYRFVELTTYGGNYSLFEVKQVLALTDAYDGANTDQTATIHAV